MAKKQKRKINVGQRDYLWYVRPESDYGGQLVLTVLSHDKQFAVQFQLSQRAPKRHITILNREFGGSIAPKPSSYRRYLCPDWAPDNVVGPGVVRALIEWCTEPPSNLVPVDWEGNPPFDEPSLNRGVI